jgi:tryptophan synthase beta chain
MSISTATNANTQPVSAVPDARGRFGEFGRRYVPETLMYALDQLTEAYEQACRDPEFERQFERSAKAFCGTP